VSVGPARRWYRVAWCLFWVLSLAPSFSHAAAPCPEKEFLKNPNAVVDFRDWEGLYASFCKFGGCDNGGRCPAKARTLCEDIHRQAAEAVAEINEVTDSAARVR